MPAGHLLDLMKLQIERPQHLIDVNKLALNTIEPTTDGGLRIGALSLFLRHKSTVQQTVSGKRLFGNRRLYPASRGRRCE